MTSCTRAAAVPTLLALVAACRRESAPEAPPAAGAPGTTPAAEGRATTRDDDAMDLYSLKVNSLEGKPVDLAQFRGKVTLVVNVASECGFTPQYKGLEALHTQLADRGFAVLGFPSNDFGAQEPGTPQQIRAFCTEKYAVDFPLFAKCETRNGPGQSPVYALLGRATGKLPSWNFCKYLVGKDGRVIAFFDSKVKPEGTELRAAIDGALR